MLLHKMNSFYYYFYEDVGREDLCAERLKDTDTSGYFQGST